MGSQERATGPKRSPRAHTSRVQIVPARGRVHAHPDIMVDGAFLHLALNTPDIPDKQFRYAVKKRYFLAWADNAPHGHHHFVILPKPVDVEGAEVRYANGVVDARMRLLKPAAPQKG